MLMLTTPQKRISFQQWITLLFILCLHIAILWIARPAFKQHVSEELQYLSVFNVRPVVKPPPTPAPQVTQTPVKKLVTASTKLAPSEVEVIKPETTINNSQQNAPAAVTSPAINLDALHSQAMQNEHSRPVSGLEKLQASQKLDLSIEGKLDRELNRIELPECRRLLLGKSMPERMMIIQDHNRKKYCR